MDLVITVAVESLRLLESKEQFGIHETEKFKFAHLAKTKIARIC